MFMIRFGKKEEKTMLFSVLDAIIVGTVAKASN